MLQLRAPGVYTQELPSGVRTITGAPTAVALFLGPTSTGIDNRPITLFNFGDFERNFGGLSQLSNLSYSVLHFFSNGGGQAVVIRIPASGAVAAANQLKSAGGAASLTLTALSSGPASNDIFFEIDPFDIGAQPFGGSPDTTKFNLGLFDRSTGRSERFGNLSMSATSARLASAVVNDSATGSNLVALTVLTMNGAVPAPTGTIIDITKLPVSPLTFANPVRVILTVTPLDAAGAPTTAISIDSVTVFNAGDPVPRTKQEFSARLIRALNAAIRANLTVKAALEGLEIDGGMVESGTLLRLRLGATPVTTVGRINDATVTLADKAAVAGFDSLVTMYGLTTKASNASRYQLGQVYPGTIQNAAPVVGINGAAHGQPADAAFLQAVSNLELPDAFFNILCLPDVVRASATDPMAPQHSNAMTIYAEAARICALKHAFLLVDTLPNVTDANAAEAWKSTVVSFQSNHSAAYFPYIRVDDPLMPGSTRFHPPSGALAGVFARTDSNVGVWQAPAGTDAFIAGAYGPSVVLSDNEQGLLNPIGLNAIRQFPIFGTVSFGSRTIDGSDALASDWKYIPVRRTASYILRSLSEGLRWAVHQPNGDALWAQLRMNVNAFMQTLFRQGAFKGVSIRDAYFVKCDADTTSATDINNGIVNIVVGFAPLKPAEFVVISLRQIVQANQ